MLNIRLLTIEDQDPDSIYNAIFEGLSKWIFVCKGLTKICAPAEDENAWVKTVEEWENEIEKIAPRYDLVFCTVDLQIPKKKDNDEGDPKNGLAIVDQIRKNHTKRIQCCVLTGLESDNLEKIIRETHTDLKEVLFDFKESGEMGFPSIINYIKAQALQSMDYIIFEDSQKLVRNVFLREASNSLRQFFFTRAPYLIEGRTWHIPALMVSGPGLGARAFLEFVAYLSEAQFVTLDLRGQDFARNQKNFEYLQSIGKMIEKDENHPRTLVYLPGLDQYTPGISGDSEEDCLGVLRKILKALPDTRTGQNKPFFLVFRVEKKSRLHMASVEARNFLRTLETRIDQMTDSPMEHLGVDANGWAVGHPRILSMPTLAMRGDDFIKNVALHFLAQKESEILAAGLQGKNRLKLSANVYDLLINKTDWSEYGNLNGLMQSLETGFQHFMAQRAANQYEITMSHFPQKLQERFHRIVFNVNNVSLSFPGARGGAIRVIEHINFAVHQGEILSILGPSGCGKSSILKLFAGLVPPASGTVEFRDQPIVAPRKEVGMVFQDYSLFPWLTVEENVAFGPKTRGVNPDDIRVRVRELLNRAGLFEARHEYPGQLSGGMRQRVAIIRALANDSEVLLMDEPFGALDLQTRWGMQEFLLHTAEEEKKTVVFVTHDIEEAVFVGNRIFIATPRPLRLGSPVIVPFSFEARNLDLRHDPAFIDCVHLVRDRVLQSNS